MRTWVELEGPIIERPVEDVFALVGDLENSPRWGRTRKTVKDPDGPDGVGALFREESRILTEKVKHQSEVTGLDVPTELSYTSRFENGLIERTRIVCAPVDGGTRIDVATEVDIERIPQLFAPFISLLVKQRLERLLTKLEEEFEPPESSAGGAVVLASLGVILLATAGLRYLIEVLPDGEWQTVLALLASGLVAAGAAAIAWLVSRRSPNDEEAEPPTVDDGTVLEGSPHGP